MSAHPLVVLRNLLSPKNRVQGKVLSVSGDKVTVAVPTGVVTTAKPSSASCRAGDTVMLDGTGFRIIPSKAPQETYHL